MTRLAPITLLLGISLACGSTGSGDASSGSDSNTTSSTTDATDTATTDTTASTTNTTSSTSDTDTTTTTDPTATTTTTDSGGSTGGGFIEPPDGGVSGQCDPMAQDCAEDEKCTAYSTDGPSPPSAPWNANKCVPVTGSLQEGDLCDIKGGKYTGEDDCAEGLICLNTDDAGMGGSCVAFCNTDMTCENSNAECAVYNDGSLPICLANCDPLLQDCPDGQGCYASAGGNGFICFKFSGEGGEGAPGTECGFVNACEPGTACLAPEAVDGCTAMSGCCSPYCDLSDPNVMCNGTEECTPWFEMGMAPPQFADVGVCAIPA